jgi:hypothetical protein
VLDLSARARSERTSTIQAHALDPGARSKSMTDTGVDAQADEACLGPDHRTGPRLHDLGRRGAQGDLDGRGALAGHHFAGRPGARGLSGLIYIDGASGPAQTAADARAALAKLNASGSTPWLAFGGIAAPFAGLFNATGSLGALTDPDGRSLGQQFPLLPADLKPPVPATNLAEYGYALNVGTSPITLAAAQGHLGEGLSQTAVDGVHGWEGSGALTPIKRFARMFSGLGMNNVDGTEWYFPQRLTDDTAAVGNGLANPAQKVLNVRSTMGRRLPRSLRIYAYGAALGGPRVLLAAEQLARQSGIPMRNLTLINRQATYAHNDPAGAFPKNVFFAHLIPFLNKLGPG